MKTADIMKVLKDDNAKRIEHNDTSKWTDKQLCEKIIFVLDKRLDETQKRISYGGDYVGCTFEFARKLLETYDSDPETNGEMILEYAFDIFIFEICNFCGCGCNIALLRDLILPFLECYGTDDNAYAILTKEKFNKRFPGKSEVEREFFAKWVDSIGLSEHGTSVYSSWLTDEGLAWREVLRRVCREEESNG